MDCIDVCFRVFGRSQREEITQQAAGPLQCPGAAGRQRVRPVTVKFRVDTDADYRRGTYESSQTDPDL